MNQNNSGDPLDTLLHQWADERTADSEHLDNLQQRIVSTLGEDDFSSACSVVSRSEHSPTFSSQPVGTRRASLAGFLVGVTLTALVALIWVTQQTGQEAPQPQLADDIQQAMPEHAQLNDDQLRDRRVLLSEMKDVFGDQLNWLAETDSRFEVGLSDGRPSNGSSLSHSDVLEIAVRVVVEERSSSDGTWQRAWAADVVSQNEQVVRLAAKNDDRTTMTMWAYVLPDGMVAIDSELDFSGGSMATPAAEAAQFQARFSNVQKDRQPSEELLTGANGVEYRVFQTVAVLNKKVG